MISKLHFVRLSILGMWVGTLVVAVAAFLYRISVVGDVNFEEAKDSMAIVFFLITPQMTIISTFFFGTSNKKFAEIVRERSENAVLAAVLSLIYHAIFIFFLTFGVALNLITGVTLDDTVTAMIFFMGLFSIVGLPPVAYLFMAQEPDAK